MTNVFTSPRNESLNIRSVFVFCHNKQETTTTMTIKDQEEEGTTPVVTATSCTVSSGSSSTTMQQEETMEQEKDTLSEQPEQQYDILDGVTFYGRWPWTVPNNTDDTVVKSKDDRSLHRLNDHYTPRVMKYAQRRLVKSNVEEYYNSYTKTYQLSSNVGTIQTVQHSQVTLGPLLGQGSFSSVYSVKGIDSGSGQEEQHDQTVVVKVLRKRLLDKPAMLAACAADLVKEGLLLASCGRHNNIVSIYGWTPTLLDGFRNGHHDAFFLLLEKLDYTLSDQLDTYWRKQYNYKTVTGAEHDSNMKRKKHSWRRPWNLKKQSTTTTASLLDDEEDDFFSTSSTSILFLQEHAKHLKFWHTRLRLAIDIATAIEFLHTKRILHRDIKVRS
jgi:hypothetical protein